MWHSFLGGCAWALALGQKFGAVSHCHCTCECVVPPCLGNPWWWEILKVLLFFSLGFLVKTVQLVGWLGTLLASRPFGARAELGAGAVEIQASPPPLALDRQEENHDRVAQLARGQIEILRLRQGRRSWQWPSQKDLECFFAMIFLLQFFGMSAWFCPPAGAAGGGT